VLLLRLGCRGSKEQRYAGQKQRARHRASADTPTVERSSWNLHKGQSDRRLATFTFSQSESLFGLAERSVRQQVAAQVNTHVTRPWAEAKRPMNSSRLGGR